MAQEIDLQDHAHVMAWAKGERLEITGTEQFLMLLDTGPEMSEPLRSKKKK